MTGRTFHLEIVTPKKVLYASEVQSFRVPGYVGSFQILYNHAPLLSLITVGELKIVDADGNDIRFATSGGFVDVKDNTVMLLAETAERADEIDVPRAQVAYDKSKRRLVEKRFETDVERTRLALERARNRLKVASRAGKVPTGSS